MVKEYKNNIFDVIKHIDDKDYSYYNSLNEESKKEIQPYTLTRWMSAVATANTSATLLFLQSLDEDVKNISSLSLVTITIPQPAMEGFLEKLASVNTNIGFVL